MRCLPTNAVEAVGQCNNIVLGRPNVSMAAEIAEHIQIYTPKLPPLKSPLNAPGSSIGTLGSRSE